MASAPKTLRDLRPASWNPRRISTKDRESLIRSYIEFGDLSGIVINQVTGNIVGGHQRTDIFKNRKTRIVSRPHKDGTGTVATGYVEIPRPDGSVTQIPYREVRFSADKEKAANISANGGGGEFDEAKLGRLMASLKGGKFAIENIAIDSTLIQKAIKAFELENKRREGLGDGGGSFSEIDPEALAAEADNCCPKCGFTWSGSTKPSFGDVHTLTKDNPKRMLAEKLQKQIKAKKEAARGRESRK